MEIERGFLQGSNAGPLLWNLSTRCTFSAFADDLLLLTESQSRVQIERKGTALIALVEAWIQIVGVEKKKTKIKHAQSCL